MLRFSSLTFGVGALSPAESLCRGSWKRVLRTGPKERLSHTNPKCRCSDSRQGALKRGRSTEAKERARQTGGEVGEAGRRRRAEREGRRLRDRLLQASSKGWGDDPKRHAVTRIALPDWATVIITTPYHAPGARSSLMCTSGATRPRALHSPTTPVPRHPSCNVLVTG